MCSRRLRAPPLTRLERITHTHTHSLSFVLGQRHAKYVILNVKLNLRFTFQFSRCRCCESAAPPPSPPPRQTASFFCFQEKFTFHTYSHTHSHTPACRCTSLAVPSFTFSVNLQLGSDGSRFLHTAPPAAGRPPLSLPPDLASSLAHAILAVTLQDLARSVATSSLKQETMQRKRKLQKRPLVRPAAAEKPR